MSPTAVVDSELEPSAEAPMSDPESIDRFLAAVMEPGEVYEIRIPKAKRGPARLFRNAAGYFDNPGDARRAIRHLSGLDAEGVYITLNPAKRGLLARSVNRLTSPVSEATSADDIVRRCLLLIDIDSVHPKGVSATEEELTDALRVRDAIAAYLCRLGFPAPVAATMSGNGGGLLYRIDLPNTQQSDALIAGALKALAAQFNSDVAKIDEGVFDAPRLTKVAGTIAAKGDHAPTLYRPWRRASATITPDAAIVPQQLLEELAQSAPEFDQRRPETATGAPRARGTAVGPLAEALERCGISFRTSKWKDDVTVYALDRCLTSTEHDDGARLFEQPSGALAYKCWHTSCRDKRWSDVRERLGFRSDALPRQRQHDHGRTDPTQDWPEPPGEAVYCGLAGKIVRTIEPTTEADPVGILATLLTVAGAAFGRSPHIRVGSDRHAAHEFTALVGRTGDGRKGSAVSPIAQLVQRIDPDLLPLQSGLSTGEGLITAVQNAQDFSLCVIEPEMSRVFNAMKRQGNNLSALIRQAWDGGRLQTMTAGDPMVVEDSHVALGVHITPRELRGLMNDTEIMNGFANRFAYLAVRRSKELPDPPELADSTLDSLANDLRCVIDNARATGRVSRDNAATQLWRYTYSSLLSSGECDDDVIESLLARAPAHVNRFSLVYALLDGSSVITEEHLLAALTLWEYCDRSVRLLFNRTPGSSLAKTVLDHLRKHGGRLTRSQIQELLSRHTTSHALNVARDRLAEQGHILIEEEANTGGRPREVWILRDGSS